MISRTVNGKAKTTTTTKKSSSQNPGLSRLDTQKMHAYLQQSSSQTLAIKGKSAAVVLGNLGSGKSTFINWMLGNPLEGDITDECEDIVKLTKVITGAPKIGHSLEACTLFPNAHPSDEGYIYVDCAGFRDNRGKEERICASISMQAAIKFAKQIKAVIIVIDWNSMQADRGTSLVNLTKTLSEIFTNPEQTSDSVIYFINKAPSKAKPAHVVLKIKKLIEFLSKKLTEDAAAISEIEIDSDSDDSGALEEHETRCEPLKRQQNAIQLLEQIIANPDNIFLADVLQGDEIKKAIKAKIAECQAIPKEYFRFNQYDAVRNKFNSFVFDIVDQAIEAMEASSELPAAIDALGHEIDDTANNIATYKKESQKLQRQLEACQSSKQFKKVKSYPKQLKEKQGRLDSLKSQITKLEEEIKPLKWELRQIDIDKLVTYRRYSVDEKRNAVGFLAYTTKKFTYNGISYDCCEMKCENGKFYNVSESKSRGIFSGTYKSGFYKNGSASITIKVKQKNMPGTKKLIKAINKKRTSLRSKIDGLKKRQEQLVRSITSLSSAISDQENEVERIKKVIDYFSLELKRDEKDLTSLKTSKQQKVDALQQAEQLLRKNHDILEFIHVLEKTVSFDSPLIAKFVEMYQSNMFLQKITTTTLNPNPKDASRGPQFVVSAEKIKEQQRDLKSVGDSKRKLLPRLPQKGTRDLAKLMQAVNDRKANLRTVTQNKRPLAPEVGKVFKS